MAKKTPAPHEPIVTTDLSFKQLMKLAATTPKSVVDERMKQAKTGKRKAK